MADTDYSTALQDEARDLVEAARARQLTPTWFRDDDARGVLEQLRRGRSVLLVAGPGVGKTSVVHSLASSLAKRGKRAPFGLRQLSCTQMMSGTRYLGEWQSKVTAIAEAAHSDKIVLHISDIWNLPRTGRTSNNDSNLLDALRPALESGRLQLLAEATPALLRMMERHPNFVSLFLKVNVAPLEADAVDKCLANAADLVGADLDAASRRSLVGLTSRFLTMRPQPGPALRLFEQVLDYQANRDREEDLEPMGPSLIETVFSTYSGLPRFVVSQEATASARDIRGWFEDRIVGQGEAIEAVVETIALFKAGLQDPQKPLGTFLFVGPTGVGKTELARALATYLFGSPSRLLRFDLSEFKDYHSFEILLGSNRDSGRPAALVDPIRAQPFQVVLFDELEKAHSNVWDVLLGLLDEGRLTPPGGETVDCRNIIFIATSNVGAQDSDRAMGFSADTGEASRRRHILRSLESHFRPEFLNRFQHVVVFHHLTREQVRKVARWELKRVLGRKGITNRNLAVDVEDAALDLVIERGFDARYGARALKREIQRQLVLPIAMTLMERRVEPGTIIRVVRKDDSLRVRVLETQESREHRREQQPIQLKERGKITLPEARKWMEALGEQLDEVSVKVDEPGLLIDQRALLERRRDPAFWNDQTAAARDLRDLDQKTRILGRLERLRGRREALMDALYGDLNRKDLTRQLKFVQEHEQALDRARRELVTMGPQGFWDCLVELSPISGTKGVAARDLLIETYSAWAEQRNMSVDWICDPQTSDEPVLLAVQGHYASGLLALESGLHRLRLGDESSVARVRVAPWTDASRSPEFSSHRALKKAKGLSGQRLRSRVECRSGLVLQNGRSLAENRDLAAELVASWDRAETVDEVVRRYSLEPPKVRDALTGTVTGKKDALKPGPFHRLLLARVDVTSG